MRFVRTLWLVVVLWTQVNHRPEFASAQRKGPTENVKPEMATKRRSPAEDATGTPNIIASAKPQTTAAHISIPALAATPYSDISSDVDKTDPTNPPGNTEGITIHPQKSSPSTGQHRITTQDHNASPASEPIQGHLSYSDVPSGYSRTDAPSGDSRTHAPSQTGHRNTARDRVEFSSPATPSITETSPQSGTLFSTLGNKKISPLFTSTAETTARTIATSNPPSDPTNVTPPSAGPKSFGATTVRPQTSIPTRKRPQTIKQHQRTDTQLKDTTITDSSCTNCTVSSDPDSFFIQTTRTVFMATSEKTKRELDNTKNDTSYEVLNFKTKGHRFNLKLRTLNNSQSLSTDARPQNTNDTQNANPSRLNASLPDDGEIVLSNTGMWTTSGMLSATKVIRLGYLTGSQIRESNQSDTFHSSAFYRRPGQVISGALTLAVVEINNDPRVLPEHRVEFLPQETYGEESESIRRTTILLDQNISAYIGPQETCMHEARLAAVFNLPMISYYCSDYTVSDKKKYPTFIRTKPTESQISRSVASLLMTYNWTKVTFVYSNEKEFQHTAKTIIELLKRNNIEVTQEETYKGPYFHNHEENPFARIVSRTFVDTRIYLMLGQSYDFVGLMANLYERGLLDTGEYFVVGVYLNYYDFTMPAKYLAGTFESDSLDRIALAFKYYIGVIHTAPVYPEYKVFTHKVNKFLEKAPFNHKNPYKVINIGKIVRPEAAYLYDAVKLYAEAAHSAWEDGVSVQDGKEIFKRIRGRTFKSVSGFYFRINSDGDAEGNFSLIARRFTKNKGWGLYPIGVFRLSESLKGYPTFHLFEGEYITWPDGRGPPLDEPPCGYRREKCIPVKTYVKEIIAGIVGGIAFIIIIILVIVYRNWKYEQDLASLLWKIDYREITFREPLENTPTPLFSRPWLKTLSAGANLLVKRDENTSSSMSQMNGAFRSSQISLGSHLDVGASGSRHLYTRIGTYKGQIVVVRKVNKRYVELTRIVRKELKVMRELRHPNINSFIGASVDGPYVLVVSEYCSKGSLQDILENDEMQLDQIFTDSLVHDIILGMIYLHDSEVKSHGKLKSSNCVVDSRWVLKITDFGLHEFMSEAKDDIGEYAYYRSLLWCAPELLRDNCSLPRGTQPGDVYSFAVVLFEIYSRKGPYGETEFTPKEIIERVRRCHNGIPFRPRLAALETTDRYMTDIIKECWDEDFTKRPDFKAIRQKLKPLLKGMKSNIFDNMMGMMEKYASNLEAVIQDRTGQLIEEKKKTEELLLRMLPRSVAEQLKRGKKVEAELFDSVTIYLSDICGFTAMSSESSPMQVVNLLNDLYTLFDGIIGNYDVYKVETIGDAYMVVSGLPKKNGIIHAGEIASMSLHLLVAIKKFRIRHRPNDTLKLRIGVHSGSCVSGVVGQKMPRYCLFGDTVNTASRIESTGQPLKIHCSQQCKELLDQLGGYEVEERGVVHLKGKGNVTTYWVVGENKSKRQERIALAKHLSPPSLTNTPSEDLSSICDALNQNPNPHPIINLTPISNPKSAPKAIESCHTNAISHCAGPQDLLTSQNSSSLYSYMKPNWNDGDPTVDSHYLKKDRNRRQELFHLAQRNIKIGSGSANDHLPENSPLLKTTFMDIDTDENLQVTPV